MKILQLCLSSSLGGLELYCLNTSKYLQKNNFEVKALLKENSLLHQKHKQVGVECLLWKGQTGKFPFVEALKIWKLIKNESFDLVHIHCKKDLPLAALLKYFSKGTFKLVHTRHMNMPTSKKNFYHNFQYKQIDLLITITNKLKSDLLKRVNINSAKVQNLYCGVDEPSKTASSKFELFKQKFEPNEVIDFRIAVFGNLNPVKAQHIIIEALALIKNELKINWKLYLIGKFIDKDYSKQIEKLIQDNKLENRVVTTGFINDAKDLMPGFDLIALTTRGETFGLVLAEAMRAKVATIGTNSEGVPEIIDNDVNGLLVEPNNPKQLANAILKLYKNEELRNDFASKGKIKADLVFNYENHYTTLENLYKTLVKY